MVPWHRGVPQGRPDQPSSLGIVCQVFLAFPLFVECGATALIHFEPPEGKVLKMPLVCV